MTKPSKRKLFSESAKALLSKTLDKVDDVELGTNGQIESLIEQTVSGNTSKSDTNQICESGEVKSRDQEQEVSYSHSGQIISQPTYDKYLSTDEHQREANFRDLIGDNEDTKMTVIDQFSAGEETIPKSFSHEALVAEHVERRHGCSQFNEYVLTGDDNIQLSHEALVAEHVERGHGCSRFNEYVLTGDDNIQLIGWEASPESYLAENQLVDGAQSRNCCRPGENTQGREPHSVSEFLFSPTNSERSELSLHSRSTEGKSFFKTNSKHELIRCKNERALYSIHLGSMWAGMVEPVRTFVSENAMLANTDACFNLNSDPVTVCSQYLVREIHINEAV
ncbi:hypothetical protein LSH36_540g00040 [Paralvinella palmiformis]|uniref:Uncharacterized protein n=1 Tax=Paralvinella palmiformis TaxID=53620 RepID=A0AAD9J813_9ANNE|nr:hypothetical protein LSH36_540g00040 [Paralvinella palmiformis]